MYKIMIVEDDELIAETLRKQVLSWGWDACCVRDFNDVLTEFSHYDPQLVLLDISLPFYNGYHWCAEIRKVSRVPVIFISSAADNMNIVMAMNMGGDDFIAKPFDLTVLIAKIQALLRRSYEFVAAPALLDCHGALLNTNDGVLSYEGGRMELTRNEHKILQMLLENRGRIVSREALMTRLWESDSFVDENTLTVNMNRLRRKLETANLSDLIKTRKGEGYLVE